jgi:hypothetical protein
VTGREQQMAEYCIALDSPRSSHDDPQSGDRVSAGHRATVRRVVLRDGQRVAYVESDGPGAVQWCDLLAWQLWCDSAL